MKKISKGEADQNAAHAKTLLEDRVFKEAIEELKQTYTDALLRAPATTDTDRIGLVRLRDSVNIVDTFVHQLEKRLVTGRLHGNEADNIRNLKIV